MSLPAELKNQIYALALTTEDGIFLISKTKRYRRTVQRSDRKVQPLVKQGSGYRSSRLPFSYRIKTPEVEARTDMTRRTLVPKILLLNKAIYAETQPILYASNTFAVEDTTAMHAFLATIGPKNRATITDLTLKGMGYSKAHKALNHPAFTMLAGAVNLTRLYIDCQFSWGTDPRRKARQLYRECFHWLEAMGVEHGRFDAAVDIIEVADRNWINPWANIQQTPNLDPEPNLEEKMKTFRAELRKLLS